MRPRASNSRARRNNRWLLTEGYAPRTVDRYRRAADRFRSWAARRSLGPLVVGPVLDDLFADYLHLLHSRGAGKAAAVDAFYGLNMLMPGAKRDMPVSRDCLRRFVKSRPSVSYPPLSWGVTCVIAVWLAKHYSFRHAIAMLLAFDCLLRSGELLALRREDVVAGGDARVGHGFDGMFIRLGQTKTGPDQSVDVLDENVQCLLRLLVAATRPRERLFPFTGAQLLAALRKACRALGLDGATVVHSARHGGATALWLRKWTLESIMFRGRWKSADSARRYIQAGRARLASRSLPDLVARMAAAFSSDLLGALRAALSQ